jgi:hypothetical protein
MFAKAINRNPSHHYVSGKEFMTDIQPIISISTNQLTEATIYPFANFEPLLIG